VSTGEKLNYWGNVQTFTMVPQVVKDPYLYQSETGTDYSVQMYSYSSLT